MSETTTLADLARRALAAYEELAALGEEIEDEWTYVTDLAASWQGRIDGVITERGGESVSSAQEAAIDRVIEEVRMISDPHRAIDWLSTFPQVVLAALGEAP